jgi:hypothetical protein
MNPHPLARFWLICLILGLGVSTALAMATYEGKVVLAGDAKLTVVETDGDNVEFVVSKETKITRDGKPAKLSDLEPGDSVRVTAEMSRTKLVASVIEARTAE